MNVLARFSALATLAAVSATIASASTITLDSYGTSGSQASSAANSALAYQGYNSSINYATTGGTLTGGGSSYSLTMPAGQTTWASALSGSSYVSSNPGDGPGGSNTEANGTYVYTSTFDLAAGQYGGTLSLLADDTATIKLNGVTIFSADTTNGYPHCATSVPNCLVVDSVNLNSSMFTTGVNTLEVDLVQGGSDRLGVDFSGSVAPTPEPSSLLLLGTGFAGSAGALFRKLRRQA